MDAVAAAGEALPDVAADVEALYRDGITARADAFTPQWADRLGEDIAGAFREALDRPGGAVGRGPHRYYVEIYPEQIRDFAGLAGHPWVRSLCHAVLGPEYRIVELGFDVPLPGAERQPWHRDFPSPEETRTGRRLTSLAFNLTTVDTEEAMGPFEIAPGTQWDDGQDFEHRMFPPRSAYDRYESRAVRKYPRRGDISARSALTIHRGTANRSGTSRPVLVLGVDGPEATNAEHHGMAVTRPYWETLPRHVRDHLDCPVVEELTPLVQQHTIEGLVMGDA
ncbi:phytanoyl-CoA dioxygenase family protein [Streptomyces sp. JJ36]|uniref:phytanoyl-CoA dioxygenase family protein n=1 Tax=Streptomyces sp. JJ36 TaxID=2736645 RepID=UPI001F235BAA|nr:phytanoyl-CoA dioxygenase family protein [Streptomyces sp. JJ36]MCF6523552.1 phytanoyl-CoA dioxygenase family protein [Streptomyces sp. JJ36]